MLKRLFALAVLALAVSARADAASRTQYYYGEQLGSYKLNLSERYQRLSDGALAQAMFGQTGGYNNLAVTATSGLTVSVGPVGTNGVGSLFQLKADDTTPFGGGSQSPVSALPADPALILLQATVTQTIATLGPLSVPATAGYSQISLIECQVQTADANAFNTSFINSFGSLYSTSVPRDRTDTASCQVKAGTASATPTVPTADMGYVGVGYVTVPSGTTTITSGMISTLPPIGLPANTFITTPSGVSEVVGFGDSWMANGGNSVASSYCSPYNTLTTNPTGSCMLDLVAQYYGVPELNLGIAGTCAAASYAGVTSYCAGGNAGSTRTALLYAACAVPGVVVLYGYAGINEIAHADAGFQAPGGLASFQSQVDAQVHTCAQLGAQVVMMNTPHQTFGTGTYLKLQQISQASTAVQQVAQQEGVRMARMFETLGPCWFDALLGPGVTNICSAADGLHPSNGSTTTLSPITSPTSSPQTVTVFTPAGLQYPVGSTVLFDGGYSNQENVVVVPSPTPAPGASSPPAGSTVTAVFTKTHSTGATLYAINSVSNIGNQLAAQAFESANFVGTIANGATSTVNATTALPALQNSVINIGCAWIAAAGLTTPLPGCTTGAGVLNLTTGVGTGKIVFGDSTSNQYLALAGGQFVMSAPLSVSGSVGGVGLASSSDVSFTVADNYPLKLNDTNGGGVGLILHETGGTPQQTQLMAGFPTTSVAGILGKVFEVDDFTAGHYDLTLDTAGDMGVLGNIATVAGVCPGNTSVVGGPCVYSGSGVPSFSAYSGSIYMRYDGSANAREYVNTSTASTLGTTWSAETTP